MPAATLTWGHRSRTLRAVLAFLALCAVASCADEPPRAESASARSATPETALPAGKAPPHAAAPTPGPLEAARLAPPRRAFDARLVLLAETPQSLADTALLLPTDLAFSRHGLLVFDVGALKVRVLRWEPRLRVRSYGRGGRGPGEHSLAARFVGSHDAPMTFDRENRRFNRLDQLADSIPSFAAPDRTITSTCMLDPDTFVGSVGANDMEFHRRRSADGVPPALVDLVIARGAAVVDPLPIPIADLRRIAPMARQAAPQQLDDSTCVLIAPYQSRFAIAGRDGVWHEGTYIEALRPVDAEITVGDGGRSASVAIPRGTKRSAVDARSWRDMIVVLFEGRTPHAARLLDFYRTDGLAYLGSLLLPAKASRIAVRGDTLAVISERDEFPVIRLWRLVPISR